LGAGFALVTLVVRVMIHSCAFRPLTTLLTPGLLTCVSKLVLKFAAGCGLFWAGACFILACISAIFCGMSFIIWRIWSNVITV